MTTQEEIWKDVPGYEGLYQASDLGRVRSLDRVVHQKNGRTRFFKGSTMKPRLTTCGYLSCGLCLNSVKLRYLVHQLVTMAFLNHRPDGHIVVVDHINNDKTDNRLVNLQLVSNRYNTSKDKNGTSKYPGVSWRGDAKKWRARILVHGKRIHLGSFASEDEAGLAYQNALKEQI